MPRSTYGMGLIGSPVVAEFVHRDVVAQAFPDVVRGHPLADHVGVIRGEVEEAAGFDGFVVHQGDVTDGRAEAGAKNAEPGVTLLLEPAEAAACIVDRLAVGLESQADVGATNLVGALVASGPCGGRGKACSS